MLKTPILFADLLHHPLNRSFPELIPLLHSKAANWIEEQGDAPASLGHWLAARNYQRAIELIVKHGYKVLELGYVHQLLNWLQQFPKEITDSQPWLCIFYSWAMVFTCRYSEAEDYLSSAEKKLRLITAATMLAAFFLSFGVKGGDAQFEEG